MITYQVDVTVPNHRVDEWMEYMTSKHISEVVATGMFLSATLHRVIDPELDNAVLLPHVGAHLAPNVVVVAFGKQHLDEAFAIGMDVILFRLVFQVRCGWSSGCHGACKR